MCAKVVSITSARKPSNALRISKNIHVRRKPDIDELCDRIDLLTHNWEISQDPEEKKLINLQVGMLMQGLSGALRSSIRSLKITKTKLSADEIKLRTNSHNKNNF